MRITIFIVVTAALAGCGNPFAPNRPPPAVVLNPGLPNNRPPSVLDSDEPVPLDFMAQIAGPGVFDERYPFPQDSAKSKELRDRKYQWARANTLAIFEKHGDTTAPWADKARKAFEAFCQRHARFILGFSGIEHLEFLQAVGEAVDAGADDPLILYWKARFLDSHRAWEKWHLVPPKETSAVYRRAMEKMPQSKYPPQIQVHVAAAIWFSLHAEGRFNKDKDMDEAQRYFWEQAGLVSASADPMDRQNAFGAIRGFLLDRRTTDGGWGWWITIRKKMTEAGAKPDAWVCAAVEGDLMIRQAWNARGSGYANTISSTAMDVFHKILLKSQARLEVAYRIDPTLPEPAWSMIAVCMGLGYEREQMETWFRRAMVADPDNFEAGTAKFQYLQPKWHGSAEECIAFADQCLRTENYRARIPMLAVTGLESLYTYNSQAFGSSLSHPTLWSRIQAAYDGILSQEPDDHSMRTRYANYCSTAGKYDIGREQFDLLGDNVDHGLYDGRLQFETLRKQCLPAKPQK
jgi:hypothetical protein